MATTVITTDGDWLTPAEFVQLYRTEGVAASVVVVSTCRVPPPAAERGAAGSRPGSRPAFPQGAGDRPVADAAASASPVADRGGRFDRDN